MAVLYERLVSANPGAPVFYLPTGAWNVAPTLTRFLSRHLYPARSRGTLSPKYTTSGLRMPPQPAQSILAIKASIGLVPAAAAMLAMLAFIRYPLTEKRTATSSARPTPQGCGARRAGHRAGPPAQHRLTPDSRCGPETAVTGPHRSKQAQGGVRTVAWSGSFCSAPGGSTRAVSACSPPSLARARLSA